MYTPPEGWAERPRLAMFLFDNNLRLSWMDPEEPIPSPLAGAPQYRDSVFDQDIVIHEYTYDSSNSFSGIRLG